MAVTEQTKCGNIVVLGAGGHGRVVAHLAQLIGYQVQGFLDPRPKSVVDGFPILGDDDSLYNVVTDSLAMGIGSRTDWLIRRQRCEYIEELGMHAPVLIAPSAFTMPSVSLGHGTQVMMGAQIQQSVSVGSWTIINSGAIIEHDCKISSHVHIGPGAVLCGGVQVDDLAFVGAGAVVREGVTIGANVTVGAGAVVVADVLEGENVMGVPARRHHGR